MQLLSKQSFYCARITVPQLFSHKYYHLCLIIIQYVYIWMLCYNTYKSHKQISLLLSMKSAYLQSNCSGRHMLNAYFPLLDWYLVSKQSWWTGDVLCVDIFSTQQVYVSQLGFKQHAEWRFTSPGCSVPTLLDSTLCVWVTVFNMHQKEV